MDTEQRLAGLARQNRYQWMALMLLTVAFYGMVTMTATGSRDRDWATVVISKGLFVKNKAGEFVVSLDANDGGDGMVTTSSASGKDLIKLMSTTDRDGLVETYSASGKKLVSLGVARGGGAGLSLYNKRDAEVVQVAPTTTAMASLASRTATAKTHAR